MGSSTGATEELDVIDKDGDDVVLAFQTSGFRSEFEDGKARGVVDEKFSFGEFGCGGGECGL